MTSPIRRPSPAVRSLPALLLLLTSLLVAPSALPAEGGEVPDPGLAGLASWLSGSFSSGEQAGAEEGFLDIRLRVVPIWEGRGDGPWLYVEQAAAIALDEPYRQRVYQLTAAPDGVYESRVFTLPGDPLRFAGAWRLPDPLSEIGPGDLALRDGCTVFLRWNGDDAFVGGTRDRDCPSDLRGASYATSLVQVFDDRLVTWDRGFDDAGEQVWGAEEGGYVFRRRDGGP